MPQKYVHDTFCKALGLVDPSFIPRKHTLMFVILSVKHFHTSRPSGIGIVPDVEILAFQTKPSKNLEIRCQFCLNSNPHLHFHIFVLFVFTETSIYSLVAGTLEMQYIVQCFWFVLQRDEHLQIYKHLCPQSLQKNKAGQTSATGATGAVGPSGPHENTGATKPGGPQGQTGITGSTSPSGPTGETGATG